jgi:hypothetical protein
MVIILRMKQYDLYPLEYVIMDADGAPIDLTNATSVTMSMLDEQTGLKVVTSGGCTIIDPTAGVIQYEWQPGETDVVSMYRIEYRIIFWDESMVTVPSNDIIWMFIAPSVHGKVTP